MLTNDEKAARFDKIKRNERRYWIMQQLTIKKATAAGIQVTEKEIDDEYKRKYGNA
jgi:hypothetical protein